LRLATSGLRPALSERSESMGSRLILDSDF